MTKIQNELQYKLVYPQKVENFKRSNDGNILFPTEYLAIEHLNSEYDYRYNQVLERAECREVKTKKWQALSDPLFNSMYLDCQAKEFKVSKDYLHSVLESKYLQAYHPFRMYFSGLPKWDGKTDYIGALVNTIATEDTTLRRLYIEKWLVNTCKCACTAGYTSDYTLVLFGGQGVGKTRWIRRLIPFQLADYFHNGAINLNDKDHTKRLASGFITFIDEIDSYNKFEMAKLKAILTQEDILYRKPYGRFETRYPRTTSFIAATNNPEFLTDETGNRRFLTLNVQDADFNHSVDMDMVFAQVYALAKDPLYISHFNKEETKRIQEENKQYQSRCELEIKLSEEFQLPDSQKTAKFLTASDIEDHLFRRCDFMNANAQKIGKMMSKLGFSKASQGGGNKRRSGYLVQWRDAQASESEVSVDLTTLTDNKLFGGDSPGNN